MQRSNLRSLQIKISEFVGSCIDSLMDKSYKSGWRLQKCYFTFACLQEGEGEEDGEEDGDDGEEEG